MNRQRHRDGIFDHVRLIDGSTSERAVASDTLRNYAIPFVFVHVLLTNINQSLA
jgi:hypothetical protein